MSDIPSGHGNIAPIGTTVRAGDRLAVIVIAGVGFVAGALVGAYLDWFWWEIGYRPLPGILAVVIVALGVLLLMIRRRIARLLALAVLAVGFGLFAGQILSPGREPLINQPGGTMTLRLESPVVTVMTGSAECQNVASQTEFLVLGTPDQQPGQLGSPDGIVLQSGDRWAFPRDNSRDDRVRLEIGVTTQLVPGSIKVLSRTVMEATASSTLEPSFSNAGGSISFRDLEPIEGPAYSGEPIDLAGTLTWTCGTPLT
jgi:hypothetical protein